MPSYKRILLKLSGDTLRGKAETGIFGTALKEVCAQLAVLHKKGVSLAVVIGGGNIWRYRDFQQLKIDRGISDSIGMLATIINTLAMQGVLESMGVKTRVLSAVSAPTVVETYIRRKARVYMEQCDLLLLAGGTGHPYFTTDSAAALRALELSCDILLKATKVDGVYTKDPQKNNDAKFLKKISYTDYLEQDLKVIDASAVSLCRDNKLPIIVTMFKKGNLEAVVSGKSVGSIIH